jgi:hypothetical protein
MIPVIQQWIGVSLSGSACFLVDAKFYWIGETGGVGGAVGVNFKGVGSFSATGGHFYSNAESVRDLSGYSYCVAATANMIPIKYGAVGASGELCLGLKGTPTLGDPFPFSGVWSISDGLSWGTPGVEVAGKLSHSWVQEVASRRTPWVPFKGDVDLLCTAVNNYMLFNGGGVNYLPCVDPA